MKKENGTKTSAGFEVGVGVEGGGEGVEVEPLSVHMLMLMKFTNLW